MPSTSAPRGSSPGGTRQKVLTSIRNAAAPPTVAELAADLGLHPNSVRLHAAALRRSGLITQGTRRHGHRGRPQITYRATARGTRQGVREVDLLASVLVEHLRTADAPRAEARRAGRTWGRRLATPESSGTDLVVTVLDEFGFEPAPEDGAIELHHCPFLEFVDDEDGVVCAVHAGMLDGLVDGSRTSVELLPFSSPQGCSVRVSTT